MPVKPDPQLLMSLSADVMLQLLQHPNINPAIEELPEIAFQHAAKLIDINMRFAELATKRTPATPSKH